MTEFYTCSPGDLRDLFAKHHYLGPFRTGRVILSCCQATPNGRIIAGAVWKLPSSRRLPGDGSWADLSRWCLTAESGKDAGSRMNAWMIRRLRADGVDTGITYADPAAGHSGGVYRASGYIWAPVWHELRPPPSGQGSWGSGENTGVKRRYVYHLRRHDRLRRPLLLDDRGAVRSWLAKVGPDVAAREASLSGYVSYGLGLIA